jgi:quinol monooxygenase YgiN
MPDTTVISTDADHITLINVFTCAADRQEDLVAALEDATVDIFVHMPGFISANIHASLDRTRVVNYAQWASVEDFEASRCNGGVQRHMAQIMSLATSADPRLFTVRAVHHR